MKHLASRVLDLLHRKFVGANVNPRPGCPAVRDQSRSTDPPNVTESGQHSIGQDFRPSAEGAPDGRYSYIDNR